MRDTTGNRPSPPFVPTNGSSPERQARAPSKRAPRGRGRFTQADVTKILKGAKKADTPIASVRFELDGSILVVPGTPESVATSSEIRDAADIIELD